MTFSFNLASSSGEPTLTKAPHSYLLHKAQLHSKQQQELLEDHDSNTGEGEPPDIEATEQNDEDMQGLQATLKTTALVENSAADYFQQHTNTVLSTAKNRSDLAEMLRSLDEAKKQADADGNDFYDQNLTLEQAEDLLRVRLRNVHGSCKRWTDVWPPEQFRDFAHSKKQTLPKLCGSLYTTAEFLHLGRRDWDFANWSTEFFAEADTLLPELLRCLYRLAQYPGCGWLRTKAEVHAWEIRRRLALVSAQKQAMVSQREQPLRWR